MSQREISKRIQRLETDIEQIEIDIVEIENALQSHEQFLAELPPEADFVKETREHGDIERRLAQKLVDWENHSAELDVMRSNKRGRLNGPCSQYG